MNEGKKIALFAMFGATVGGLWSEQIVLSVLCGAAFYYLLFYWENDDQKK